MKYVYRATLHPENDGRFSIWFADLPGCATQGDNLTEAIDNARDALGLWLTCAVKERDPIPAPTLSADIALEPGETLTPIDIDLIEYQNSLNGKTVKKTISMPEWLFDMSRAAGISLSQAMQETLYTRLGLK